MNDHLNIAAIEFQDRPSIPPRSRLYSIQPMGWGTGMVESLTSYIARLAAAHSLRVSTLVRDLIAPETKVDSARNMRGDDLLRKAGAAINGSGEISSQISRIFGTLTGWQSLERLTMQFSRGWIAVRPLISPFQKWCPECLEEMRGLPSGIYYPLLWNVERIEVCPAHLKPLAIQCSRCTKKHYPLCRRLVLGFCPHCSEWLGDQPTGESQVLASEAQVFTATQLKRLIAERESFPASNEESRWAENVKRLVDLPEIGSAHALSQALSIAHETVGAWLWRGQLPSLSSLLMVSYAFDKEASELLTTRLEEPIHLARSSRSGSFRQVGRPPLKRHDAALLLKEMKNAAEEPGFPPVSLKQVCQKVGCHQSFAARKFPQLAEQIKANWISYRKIRKQQREFFAGLLTKSVASNIAGAGDYPSHRKMKEKLPSWISLRDQAARNAWLEVLQEWGLRRIDQGSDQNSA